jgi:replicative DNA helicase
MRDLEKDIISACMFSKDNLTIAIEDGVETAWFANPSNRLLFDELVDISHTNDWSQRSNVAVLQSAGMFKKFPSAMDICAETPDWAFMVGEFGNAIDALRYEYANERLKYAASTLISGSGSGDDPFEVSSAVIADLEGLENMSATTDRTTKEIVRDALKIDEKIINGEAIGLPFPWIGFNRKTFGIPMKAVTPMAGRDGKGKSRLATFLAYTWVRQGIPILYFAFEDTSERFARNFSANHSEYDTFTLKRDYVAPEFIEKHKESMHQISEMPIYIDDYPTTAERLMSKIASYKRKYGIQGVVVDGFKDLIATKGENRTQQEGHMFKTLKQAAVKYDVAILTIMHLVKMEENDWIYKDNIRGSAEQTQSSRMSLMYQDAGLSNFFGDSWNYEMDDCIALQCQKASYGEKAIVVLRPNLEQGRFDEVAQAGQTGQENR